MFRIIRTSIDFDYKVTTPILFWKDTKGSHLLGVSLGVIDRLDRFIIAFYFPTGTLAKYSAMSSLISYFRFLPEFFSRIMISGFILPNEVLRRNKILVISIFSLAVSTIVIISRIFISNFLGQEWLLPGSIFIAFGVQEILRGAYQISLNYNSKLNLSFSTSVIPIVLVILVLILPSFTLSVFGIIGIPIAFSAAFMVAITLAFFWRKNAK